MAENSQAVIPDNLIIVDGEIGLPSSSASDAGKVLAVDSNGDPSWVTPSGGTQYTEGNGIDISDQNVVSIDTSVVATKTDLSGLQGELTAGTGIDITNDTISVDTSVIATKSEIPAVPTVDTVYDATSTNPQAGTAVASAISTAVSGIEQVPSSTSADSGKVLTVDASGEPSWVTPSGGTQYSAGNGIDISAQNAISVDTTVVATKTDLGYVRQVPVVNSADNGKVLTASYSLGIPVFGWATPQAGTTYTAGNMISLANDAVAVSTTAGITDIQLVNALPANPVATVLYLIPET